MAQERSLALGGMRLTFNKFLLWFCMVQLRRVCLFGGGGFGEGSKGVSRISGAQNKGNIRAQEKWLRKRYLS